VEVEKDLLLLLAKPLVWERQREVRHGDIFHEIKGCAEFEVG